jgi:hypothetical protein
MYIKTEEHDCEITNTMVRANHIAIRKLNAATLES